MIFCSSMNACQCSFERSEALGNMALLRDVKCFKAMRELSQGPATE